MHAYSWTFKSLNKAIRLEVLASTFFKEITLGVSKGHMPAIGL
jgi:hypothetical protein